MKNNFIKTVILFLIAIDLIVWYFIFFPGLSRGSELYFLKVGQGDSSLAVLPGGGSAGVKFLIDGGPLNGGLGANLGKIFKADDRYIDLVFVTHPEVDHFGGLIGILKNYEVGAILYNGAESGDVNWKEFNKILLNKNIRKITLNSGDKIIYENSEIKVLGPIGSFANSNDSGLVLAMETGGLKALFTADISAKVEKILSKTADIKADILKVSHHGSKYSSDLSFLEEVKPKISVIEVGKNSYGHPTKEALERLSSVGSKIFNTYEQGIIKIVKEGGELKVFNL